MTDSRATVFSPVMDTTGRIVSGDVTIELMPGVGVTGPTGEHLDRANGPHTVPLAFAAPLIASRRARVVEPVIEERAPEPDRPVVGAPEGVVHRDPVVASRGRKR